MASQALAVEFRQLEPIPLDVSFCCEPGDVLAIFGPSGSGKTTILRSIAGLYEPTEARVRVGSETWTNTADKVSSPVHRRAVGVVFQDYALFPHLTAEGNVLSALGHLPKPKRKARAMALLDQVHLSSQADRKPGALSGGERQRVAVARALARDPAVLLLDEPFAAVDRAVRRRLQDEIDEIRRTLDIPVVLVTHDFDDVVRLATHLLLLDRGRVVESGPLDAVTSKPDSPWLRVAAGLGSVCDAQVTRIHPERGLAELTCEGAVLWCPNHSLKTGVRVRVRIPAREVIIATEVPRGLSVHNALPGTVTALHLDPSRDHVTVQVVVGGMKLLAEITPDAVSRLDLAIGTSVHALIKSVSVEVYGHALAPRLNDDAR